MALESLLGLDVSVLLFINKSLANPVLDALMTFTQSFTYVFWILLILFLAFGKKREIAILMIITAIISLGVSSILKTEISRERPYQVLDVRQLVPDEDNTSFPSNHVLLSTALSTIVFAYYRKYGSALFVLSGIIALGRVYLGVHYPSDVLGGVIIGAVIGLLVLYANKSSRS